MINFIKGDALEELKKLPSASVNTCVTSPPYWALRNYETEGQLGLEPTPEEYILNLTKVFKEVKRVLRGDGTLWLNIADTYCGTGHKGAASDPLYKGRNAQSFALNNKVKGVKKKELIGLPWRLAFALQQQGWYLRQDIIWYKPNCMPEPVKDRCTKSHEYIFLFSKNQKYYYDYEAIKEEGAKQGTKRNKRSVWQINTEPFKGAHFAVMPSELAEQCILAGCPEGGTVLDPFGGAGTTGLVAKSQKRNSILIELNQEYIDIAKSRISP